MPIPDLASNTVALVSLVGNLNSQRIISTFHYRLSSSPTPGTEYIDYLDKLFAGLDTAGALIPKYLACLTSDYTLERVRIQPVYPTRQRYVQYPLLASGTFGTPVVDKTPNQNLAASVKRVTNFIGSSGVGRVQMPTPNNQTSGGFLVDVNGYVTALQDFGNTFLDDIVTVTPTATWKPCLFGPGYVTTGVYDLVDWEVESTVRTMHRRTTFLGE